MRYEGMGSVGMCKLSLDRISKKSLKYFFSSSKTNMAPRFPFDAAFFLSVRLLMKNGC